MIRNVSRALLGALLLGITSCGDPAAPKPVGPPASLQIVSGSNQSGVAGSELANPLVVRVVDANDVPVPGQAVNFHVIAGGGSAFGGVALTNSAGIAQERWTLGTVAGAEQKLQARAVDSQTGAAVVFADFVATAVAGSPFTITATAGNGQTVAAGAVATDSLTVVVRDKHSNPVAGVTVTWAAVGGGAVSPATSTTNPSGQARTAWTAGPSTSATQYATAEVGPLTTQFTATMVAGSATQLLLTQPASGAAAGAPFTQQPIVRIADALGNTVATSASVSVTASGGGTVTGGATAAASNGVATFTDVGLNGLAGDYTLTFTSPLNGGLTKTQAVALAAGSATRYVVTTSASSATVGATFNVQAQATDVSGNAVPLSGRTVTWSRTGNGGSFGSPSSTTNASGVAATTFTVSQSHTASSVSLTGTDNASLTGTASAVAVSTGPAAKLGFGTQPADAAYATFIPAFTVKVLDQYDNLVSTDTRTVSIALTASEAGSSLSGTTSRAAVGGVATFADLSIDKAGPAFTLGASSSGLSAASSASFPVARIATLANVPLVSSLALGSSRLYYSYISSLSLHVQSVDLRGGAMVEHHTEGTPTVADVDLSPVIGDSVRWVLTSKQLGSIAGVSLTTGQRSSVQLTGKGLIGLARDDASGSVYYRIFDFGQIYRRSAAGTTTTLYDATPLVGDLGARTDQGAITVADGFMYFFDDDSLRRIPTAGGGASTLTTVAKAAYNGAVMVVSGGMVYYTGYDLGGVIRAIPVTGGTPASVVSGLSPRLQALTADGDWLYFIDSGNTGDDGTIKRFRMSDPSQTLETFASGELATALVIDATSVYWIGNGKVRKAPK